jgi:hypothetical protein
MENNDNNDDHDKDVNEPSTDVDHEEAHSQGTDIQRRTPATSETP